MVDASRSGPLSHLTVIELEGVGPTPFAGMVLADLGARVIRVDRPAPSAPLGFGGEADLFGRGKQSIVLDLKSAVDRTTVLALVRRADVLLEGHRPGVMERLELGPEHALRENPRLIYARITGYGQDGPLAACAGHDANYLALAGVLDWIGIRERSVLPHNLLADFAGGGMLAVTGVLAALAAVARDGRGQVIDVAMVDGVALLSTMLMTLRHMGLWREGREQNLFDGAAPFYSVYATKDGGQYVLAAVEPQFFSEFLRIAGIDAASFGSMLDPGQWPAQRARLAEVFAARTRAEWDALLAGTDTCATPILPFDEAVRHPHNVARGTFVERGGIAQPAPAPRFSRTPASIGAAVPARGADTAAILAELASSNA